MTFQALGSWFASCSTVTSVYYIKNIPWVMVWVALFIYYLIKLFFCFFFEYACFAWNFLTLLECLASPLKNYGSPKAVTLALS